MFDAEVAVLYGLGTQRLNEQVSNRSGFPDDFLFQLAGEEVRSFRAQFAISKKGSSGKDDADTFMIPNGNNSIRSFSHRL